MIASPTLTFSTGIRSNNQTYKTGYCTSWFIARVTQICSACFLMLCLLSDAVNTPPTVCSVATIFGLKTADCRNRNLRNIPETMASDMKVFQCFLQLWYKLAGWVHRTVCTWKFSHLLYVWLCSLRLAQYSFLLWCMEYFSFYPSLHYYSLIWWSWG